MVHAGRLCDAEWLCVGGVCRPQVRTEAIPGPGAPGRWQLQDNVTGLYSTARLYRQAENLHVLQVCTAAQCSKPRMILAQQAVHPMGVPAAAVCCSFALAIPDL
jgi:hypothetical protein